jgi:hypothetical protein
MAPPNRDIAMVPTTAPPVIGIRYPSREGASPNAISAIFASSKVGPLLLQR